MKEAPKKFSRVSDLVEKYYPEGLYREKVFLSAIRERSNSSSRVLDAGCGFNAFVLGNFVGKVGQCVGIDLVRNFSPPEGLRVLTADLAKMPFRDGCFDVVFSRSVCEHMVDPVEAFREAN